MTFEDIGIERGVVVAGTDTGVGKTLLSALLTIALDAEYWKPVQSGLDGESDTETVARVAALPRQRLHREAYRLTRPLSPDQSAAHDGVAIERARLRPPATDRALIIELAGGLLVPYGPELLQIDLLGDFQRPVVLAARSGLGTLNHTLLSVEALAARRIPAIGVVIIGDEHRGNVRSLAQHCRLPIIGWIPPLGTIERHTLHRTYLEHFVPPEGWRVTQWT